jgi:hypothetical protein
MDRQCPGMYLVDLEELCGGAWVQVELLDRRHLKARLSFIRHATAPAPVSTQTQQRQNGEGPCTHVTKRNVRHAWHITLVKWPLRRLTSVMAEMMCPALPPLTMCGCSTTRHTTSATAQ